MIELALMGVVPFCPRCGAAAIFLRRPERHGDLVPVVCGASREVCQWQGVSRIAVEQPKVRLQTHDPVCDTEPSK